MEFSEEIAVFQAAFELADKVTKLLLYSVLHQFTMWLFQ